MTGIRLLNVVFAALSTVALAAEDARVEFDEFTSHLAVDWGQIVRGKTTRTDLRFQPMNRNTVSLEQNAAYGDAWEFSAGLMGIIWWPFNPKPTEPIHRTMRVEPRIELSRARLNFSVAENQSFLDLGVFPYKYNPDAKNLGEYLYRSGTYPGIVYTTDGFELLDHARYQAYGARLHVSQFGGHVGHDVNFFLEATTLPVGDVTPAYEISLAWPLFQAGAGVAWNRLLSPRPSLSRPKTPDNAYARVRDLVTDSLGAADTVELYGRLNKLVPVTPLDTVIYTYWNKRGVKLMARAAVDFGRLMPQGVLGTEDLRLFGEVAVLGWEDQPFFYEDLGRRIPVMLGFNLPAFRLLDVFSLQAEYYAARFDNIKSSTELSLPVWDVESFANYNPAEYRRDDWKWSLYARKSVGRLFKIHAQAANDHLRLREFLYNESEVTLTRTPRHWYYLLRLEFGV